MKRRLLGALLLSTVLLVSSVGTANATHPEDLGQACHGGRIGELFTSPDGELHVCAYDGDIDAHIWVPIMNGVQAPRARTFNDGTNCNYVVSAMELLNTNVLTVSDFYSRGGPACNWNMYQNAGNLAHYSKLWKWNGSTWVVCQESGWNYSTSMKDRMLQRFAYGVQPCGVGYYGNEAWGAQYANGWKVGTSVWSGYIYVGGSSAAAASSTEAGAAPVGQPYTRAIAMPKPPKKR